MSDGTPDLPKRLGKSKTLVTLVSDWILESDLGSPGRERRPARMDLSSAADLPRNSSLIPAFTSMPINWRLSEGGSERAFRVISSSSMRSNYAQFKARSNDEDIRVDEYA